MQLLMDLISQWTMVTELQFTGQASIYIDSPTCKMKAQVFVLTLPSNFYGLAKLSNLLFSETWKTVHMWQVEIQKLTSQKEYFERSIADLEKDLHGAIEEADTTERDARLVHTHTSHILVH